MIEATEYGACAIAILLVLDLTEFTVIERSRKGTGFDYWLGDEENLFQQARLEISGILKGSRNDIAHRVDEKRRQTARAGHSKTPAYVCAVEFGGPVARMVTK
jgi:hypothetical protein